ncbi:unnamed protein product [Choristocarpus tenellus]
MDIGREKGTWMPQTWGLSGRRIYVDLIVDFLPDGVTLPRVLSPFIDISVSPGRWQLEAAVGKASKGSSLRIASDTCRFWVEVRGQGFTQGDVSIPAGKIYFAVPAWGGRLSKKGIITVRQKR